MGGFIQQLRANPPSQSRLQLVKRLDQATGSTEISLELAMVNIEEATKPGDVLSPSEQLFFSMTMPSHYIEGANALLHEEKRVNSEKFWLQIKSEPERLKTIYEYAVMANFLYTYRSLSDDELERYLAFAESDSGRRYHRTVFKALQKIQHDAALHIAQEVGRAFAG